MSVVSLAIVGKANTPIYLKEFLEGEEDPFGQSSASCSLKQQFILHAALDRFEQLSGPPPGCAWREKEHRGDTAMFAGLLCPVEDMRVYGFMTTTQIKFIVTVFDSGVPTQDGKVQKLLASFHSAYIHHMLNPFSAMTRFIESPRFDAEILECVNSYNER